MSALTDTLDIPELEEIRKSLNMVEEEYSTQEIVLQRKIVDFEGITDLSEFNSEMDEIANETFNNYKDLVSTALDLPTRDAAEMLKSACQMVDISLKAKIAKTDAKLKSIQLALKKPTKDEKLEEEGILMDRNAILKMLETK